MRGRDDEDEHRRAFESYLERPDATAFVAIDGDDALELESAVWRERAHAFYKREGMMHSGHAFVKTLGELEWPPQPR